MHAFIYLLQPDDPKIGLDFACININEVETKTKFAVIYGNISHMYSLVMPLLIYLLNTKYFMFI